MTSSTTWVVDASLVGEGGVGEGGVVARRHRRRRRSSRRQRGFDRTRALEDAHDAMRRGHYTDAIAAFELVVRENPTDIRSRLKLADLYAKVGWPDQAAGLLRAIAAEHEANGMHARAVSVCKQILTYEPGAPDVYAALARLYRAQKLWRDAGRYARLAAAAFAGAGRPIERLRVLRDHVAADPDAVVDRLRLAEHFADDGHYDAAGALLREAWERLEEAGDRKNAAVVANRLLHFVPNDLELKRTLAAHAVERNDPGRAFLLLRGCFRAHPNDHEVLGLLVQAFLQVGQPVRARPALRRLSTVCRQAPDAAATCDAACRPVCVRLTAVAAGPPPPDRDDESDFEAAFGELDLDWSALAAPCTAVPTPVEPAPAEPAAPSVAGPPIDDGEGDDALRDDALIPIIMEMNAV